MSYPGPPAPYPARLIPPSGSVRRPAVHSGVLPAIFQRHSAPFRRKYRTAAPACIVMIMKSSAHAIAAALAVTLSAHILLFLAAGAAAATLLVYAGIALPAVWSDKPARRKAAAAVLHQILNARIGA